MATSPWTAAAPAVGLTSDARRSRALGAVADAGCRASYCRSDWSAPVRWRRDRAWLGLLSRLGPRHKRRSLCSTPAPSLSLTPSRPADGHCLIPLRLTAYPNTDAVRHK